MHNPVPILAAVTLVLSVAGCTGEGPVPTPASASAATPAPAAVAGPAGAAEVGTGRCRVGGPGPAAELTALTEACERALPAVEDVWPQWSGPAHIVRSPDPLEPGTAAQVEGVARPGEPAEGDRLVVAPGLVEQVSGEGLDLVLRHELTHLAMRATGTAPIPLWAAEGLAEHVGYASVPDERRHRRAELGRLRDRVEAGTWTGTVPSPDRFTDPDERADAYTAAWLGVEVLVGRHGLEAVTAAMREGDSAWLSRLGETSATVADQWHEELVSRTPEVD